MFKLCFFSKNLIIQITQFFNFNYFIVFFLSIQFFLLKKIEINFEIEKQNCPDNFLIYVTKKIAKNLIIIFKN